MELLPRRRHLASRQPGSGVRRVLVVVYVRLTPVFAVEVVVRAVAVFEEPIDATPSPTCQRPAWPGQPAYAC